MDNISIDIPYMVLSTKVNQEGKTEKRVLTPFGAVDVIFPRSPEAGRLLPHLEVEVDGDIEHWNLYDHTITEFKDALLYFFWGIVQRHMGEDACHCFDEFCVRVKGAEVSLTLPIGTARSFTKAASYGLKLPNP